MCAEVQTLCNMPAIKTGSILADHGVAIGCPDRPDQHGTNEEAQQEQQKPERLGSVVYAARMAHGSPTGHLSHPFTETFGLLESRKMVIHKPVMIITYSHD